jgi:hypothetical protein
MTDGRAAGRRPHDPLRLSMWTVMGAVAASVLTAGTLGGMSGILQIPNLTSGLEVLNKAREAGLIAASALGERTRSSELVEEAMQRQLNQLSARLDQIQIRIDRKDLEDRNTEIQTQKDLALLEGRSKDRNTEANGSILALRSEITGLSDRTKQNSEAVNIVRQNVYDLATRIYRQGTQQSLPLPLEPKMPSSLIPPYGPHGRQMDTRYEP